MANKERDLIQRQSNCIAQQTATIAALEKEIEALKAEVARLDAIIRDEGDALAHLRKIYSDPSSSTAAVLRACDAALPFERSRQPVLAVNAFVGFAERLRERRLAYYARMNDAPDDDADDPDAA
jgi:hypothetical protein